MIELIHTSLAGSAVITIDMHFFFAKFAHDQQIQIFFILRVILFIEPRIGRISEHKNEVVN